MPKHKPIQTTVAGFTFHLENIRRGIHSEETPDYTANLFCNGKKIGTVSNRGDGGATNFSISPGANIEETMRIQKKIGKAVWLTCDNGDRIHHNLGTVADTLYFLEESAPKDTTRKPTQKGGRHTYTVGVTLPIFLCLEIEADSEQEAIDKARKQAIDTPTKQWGDDFSYAEFNILETD